MFHNEFFRSDLPQPQPVEPDVCTRLVARRGIYLSYLRRRVSDPDTANDLLQDFNLKVIQAFRRTERILNTDAWLARVLRNTLFDHYRRRDVRRRADAAYANHVTALSGPEGMALDQVETDSVEENLFDIVTALASIRPDQAELIRALYMRDQSRESLARQLNVTIGTLNVRVLRARHALRNALVDLAAKADATSPLAASIADRAGAP